MPKFLVTYLTPASVIEEWKKTDPEKRKAAEEKMRGDWTKWMTDHAKALADKGAGVGKRNGSHLKAFRIRKTRSCCIQS